MVNGKCLITTVTKSTAKELSQGCVRIVYERNV